MFFKFSKELKKFYHILLGPDVYAVTDPEEDADEGEDAVEVIGAESSSDEGEDAGLESSDDETDEEAASSSDEEDKVAPPPPPAPSSGRPRGRRRQAPKKSRVDVVGGEWKKEDNTPIDVPYGCVVVLFRIIRRNFLGF